MSDTKTRPEFAEFKAALKASDIRRCWMIASTPQFDEAVQSVAKEQAAELMKELGSAVTTKTLAAMVFAERLEAVLHQSINKASLEVMQARGAALEARIADLERRLHAVDGQKAHIIGPRTISGVIHG